MKKYLQPFGDTIILFGIIHLCFGLILLVKNADISYLNAFYIISASDLFPGIEKGILSGIISLILVGITYGYYYTKRNKKKDHKNP